MVQISLENNILLLKSEGWFYKMKGKVKYYLYSIYKYWKNCLKLVGIVPSNLNDS